MVGQRVTSDVLGTVRDPSGAVAPDVKVRLLRTETGETRETATNNQGEYRISGLEPGNYEIHFEKTGFRSEVRTGVDLLVNQQATVDAALAIGDVREQVTVEADASRLEEESSGLSGVVTAAAVHELPLNGRD